MCKSAHYNVIMACYFGCAEQFLTKMVLYDIIHIHGIDLNTEYDTNGVFIIDRGQENDDQRQNF